MYLPKNFAKAGIIGLTMFIIYKIMSKGETIKNLKFAIEKINYTFTSEQLILTLMIRVNNNEKENILLNNIDAELLFNNEVLGKIKNDLNILVPVNNSVLIPVSVEILLLPTIQNIIKIITGKFQGIAMFNLKGKIKVEDLSFPINLKYSFL